MNFNYSNVKELSQDLAKCAEQAQSLKLLYYHRENVDDKAIVVQEKEYSQRKLSVINWLKEPQNYEMFKASADAKKALLYKYVSEGYFDHEIGIGSDLKDKVTSDFKEIYSNTPAQELLTNREKQNLEHYAKNNVAPEKRYQFTKEHQAVLQVRDRSVCFNQDIKFLKEHLPNTKVLGATGALVVKMIEENPHFLNDSPNHFLVNHAGYKDKAPTVAQLHKTLHDAASGLPQAKESLDNIQKLFEQFKSKASITQQIRVVRDEYMPKPAVGVTLKNN